MLAVTRVINNNIGTTVPCFSEKRILQIKWILLSASDQEVKKHAVNATICTLMCSYVC